MTAQPGWSAKKLCAPVTHVTVFADDFSGACDTGIVFKSPVCDVLVHLDTTDMSAQRGSQRVDVFHSDTRKYPAVRAAAIAGDAARQVPSGPGQRVYQKIDSTMRGSVGAEVNAILTALGWNVAVLCPAFPAMGRTVVSGRLLVDGQPISTTDYGRDPRNPISLDALADLVHQTDPTLDVRACTPGTLVDVLLDLHQAGCRCVIAVDATTTDDLQQIADVLADCPNVLPVGSAGLARALASSWGLSSTDPPRHQTLRVARSFIVSGSANPRSISQLAVLAVEDPRYSIVRIDKGQLLTKADADQEISSVNQQIRQAMAENSVLAVALSDERQPGQPYQGTFESFVASMVADTIKALPEQLSDIAITAGGADTCLSLCRMLGVRTLAPQEEVVPGLPWSIADNGLNVISKAGGFGDDRALLACARFVHDPSNPFNPQEI
ncbi:MAG: hypothetical protein LBV30_05285 [Propionibacteriaceae bacterium]|jgi:uncharacterized protein YgbK (DUF1537 family)|nr:hypothetical protein [Propionibacteriaceae bacterium]